MSNSRTLRRGIAAAVLLVSFLLQGTWALAGTTGGLAGTIKDSTTGAPIAGVQVEAVSPSQNASATTDAGGHFVLQALAPDTYTLNFTKEGYQPISQAGNVVFADQTIQINLSMSKALKQIARVTSQAGSSLVKSGVGGDLYSVNSQAISSTASSTGSGNLNTAYSAIATVPGLYVGTFGAGWNQAVVVRGQNPWTTGYEYDGIPVNRAFDNYNSSTESNLGLTQLEVYTGGGPSSIASNGISGFINQVIKTGTYPGYATLNGGIGTGAFYHQASIEAGGATPDRNFSYYVGLSGYNQTYNYFNQQDGAQFMGQGGMYASYGGLFTPTSSGQSDVPVCGPNALATGFGGAPGCYSYLNGLANDLQQLTDRESIINLHFGIPRKNGQKDDVQLLWSASAERSVFDYNPSTPNLNFVTQANSGLPYEAGVNYPHYADGLAYNDPFGTPIATCSTPSAASNPKTCTGAFSYTAPTPYLQPNSGNHAIDAPLPTNYYGDLYNNDTGITKVQYTHPFNDRSYLRIFGYTFFSDWTEDGPTGGYSWAVGNQPVSPNYDLITHTGGGELQYSNQLNDQNLLTFTGNYTSASVVRLNNTWYSTADPFLTFASPGGAACGGEAALTLGYANCPYSLTQSAIGYMHIGAGANPFTCYDPTSGKAEPCTPGGSWQSKSFKGPTGYGAGANADWVTLWNGNNNGTLNQVRPNFANLSLSDEFRPNDKWLIDASVKYDNYEYGMAPSNNLADQFAAYQVANYSCVNRYSSAVLVNPLTPGTVPPPSPIYTSGDCNAAYKALNPSGTQTTGWTHPNGTVQDGVQARTFTNVSPSGYDMYYYSPRLAITYTQSPDTVWRFSGGRYTEPPLSAAVQYLYSSGSGATSLWTNFMGDGFYSPFHPIAGETSAQYDLSYEHHMRNTDWSLKITPFYTQTANWEQQAFIGTGFVTQVPVGKFQSEGVEAAITKGDFSRNGLSGQLAFTYTHAAVQYQSLLVPNLAATMNQQITQFNALTKAGGGAPCYAPFHGNVKPMPCNKPRAIINPYYNYPLQGTIDPNGWYPASIYQLPPAFGPSYGIYAQSYTSPYVATMVLNWRQNKLAITPSLQFESGTAYGSPMDVAGIDPRTCQSNQSFPAAGFNPVPGGNGKACNYLSQAGVGATGYLYIPNPQTLHFASLGSYVEPDLLTGNIQVSYDLSSKVRLSLTGANLFRSCFGGSAEPWTAAYPPSPNVCGYGTNGNAYVSNYYNGNSPTNRTANPGGGTIPAQLQSYGPSSGNGASFTPLPFTLFVQAQIKL